MSCTRMRIPRMQGRPPHFPSSTVIRFNRPEDIKAPISVSPQRVMLSTHPHAAEHKTMEGLRHVRRQEDVAGSGPAQRPARAVACKPPIFDHETLHSGIRVRRQRWSDESARARPGGPAEELCWLRFPHEFEPSHNKIGRTQAGDQFVYRRSPVVEIEETQGSELVVERFLALVSL